MWQSASESVQKIYAGLFLRPNTYISCLFIPFIKNLYFSILPPATHGVLVVSKLNFCRHCDSSIWWQRVDVVLPAPIKLSEGVNHCIILQIKIKMVLLPLRRFKSFSTCNLKVGHFQQDHFPRWFVGYSYRFSRKVGSGKKSCLEI